MWSKAVENAYIKYLDVSEEAAKKIRGRGKVTLRKMTPQAEEGRKNEEDHIRNKWSREALRCLKQPRRGEQVVYRAGMMMKQEAGIGAYAKLNKEALAIMNKSISKEVKWENEQLPLIRNDLIQAPKNTPPDYEALQKQILK